MMIKNLRRNVFSYSIASMLALLLIHCGSATNDSDDPTASRIAPHLHLTRAATSSSTAHPQTVITRYEILLSRNGDAVAYTGAPADAREISVPEVPLGEGYRIEVTGYNAQADAVFVGAVDQLTITDAEQSIEVALQQVPLFADLRESAVVANTRFAPRVIAAPGNSVELAVTNVSANAGSSTTNPEILPDLATNSPSLTVPIDRGETAFHPAPLAPGAYRVRAHDLTNGRMSERTIVVTDGKLRRGAPLVSFARTVGDQVRVSLSDVWAANQRQSMLAWWLHNFSEKE